VQPDELDAWRVWRRDAWKKTSYAQARYVFIQLHSSDFMFSVAEEEIVGL
jgi:hypothetical protein